MSAPYYSCLGLEDQIVASLHSFHFERVHSVAQGTSLIGQPDNGSLVVHLLPHESVERRLRLTGSDLKKHGALFQSSDFGGGQYRFNCDGYVAFSGSKAIRAYTQLYRDGRVEAVMADVVYKQDRALILREAICERALLNLASSYLEFYAGAVPNSAVWLFASLVGCQGARVLLPWHGLGEHSIERQVVPLPSDKLLTDESNTAKALRPLCDALWQACGHEQSLNFDDNGCWQPRRR